MNISVIKTKLFYSGIIYSYTNKHNGKVYVGQTTRPKIRHQQHVKAAQNFSDSVIFHKAIRKYGVTSFVYKIEKIITCNSYALYKKRIDYYEKEFIKFYDSKNNGYNMTNGGGNVWNNEFKKGVPLSEEHKKKISESGKKLHKTKNNSMEHNPKAKKVICIDENNNVIKIYKCAKFICNDFDINYSTLRLKLQTNKCKISNYRFYYEVNFK